MAHKRFGALVASTSLDGSEKFLWGKTEHSMVPWRYLQPKTNKWEGLSGWNLRPSLSVPKGPEESEGVSDVVGDLLGGLSWFGSVFWRFHVRGWFPTYPLQEPGIQIHK